jgi:biotin transport system substrate-specific component
LKKNHQIARFEAVFETKAISSPYRIIFSACQIVAASLLIGLLAQIKIPLFFTPVPLSFQTFAVMVVTLFLGPCKGPISVLLYLLEGGMGLPLFAGGASGFAHFIGPTGGYLIGFFLQSLLIGKFLNLNASKRKTFFVLLLSSFVVLGFGVLWLGQFVGFEKVLFLGFFPFILGDILKVFAATAFYTQQRSLANFYKHP